MFCLVYGLHIATIIILAALRSLRLIILLAYLALSLTILYLLIPRAATSADAADGVGLRHQRRIEPQATLGLMFATPHLRRHPKSQIHL